MKRSVPFGRRNLFEDQRRFALAMLGIGSGLLMVLLMQAVFAGFTKQETAYLDSQEVDVIVSQAGVRTMQMSVSSLPEGTLDRVRSARGVSWAEPLRQMTTTVTIGDRQLITYLIGYDTARGVGGPRRIEEGVGPRLGEVILDAAGAQQLGVGVGGTVTILGREMRVSGLTSGLTGIANTSSFVTSEQFASLVGAGTNYVFVGASRGMSAEILREQIEATAVGVTVQTKAAFSVEEAAFVSDLYRDVIGTMIGIGYAIALALVALSLSSVTSSKLRDYGVVKALGATKRQLVATVASQAFWSVVVATTFASASALALAAAIDRTVPNIELVIEPGAVLTTLGGALLVGAPGAVLPLRRVLRVDPATSFSGPGVGI